MISSVILEPYAPVSIFLIFVFLEHTGESLRHILLMGCHSWEYSAACIPTPEPRTEDSALSVRRSKCLQRRSRANEQDFRSRAHDVRQTNHRLLKSRPHSCECRVPGTYLSFAQRQQCPHVTTISSGLATPLGISIICARDKCVFC